MQIGVGVETAKHVLPTRWPWWHLQYPTDTEPSRGADLDYQFKFFSKRGNSCSGAATCVCSCEGNTLHTCTQMMTSGII